MDSSKEFYFLQINKSLQNRGFQGPILTYGWFFLQFTPEFGWKKGEKIVVGGRWGKWRFLNNSLILV